MPNYLIIAVFICFGLVGLSFMGYPIILGILVKLRRSSVQRSPIDPLPKVTLLIAAYNEENIIQEKIENSLALDYPKHLLEIIVFSDGSTDRTDAIVQSNQDRGVSLVRVEGRRGKTHCQNTLVAQSSGEILVFSDANSMYEPQAILALVSSFADPRVGCAIGKRIYVGKHKAGNKEGLYERLETWMKAKESLLGGTIGANGSIYALRASLYIPLPDDRISDINEPLRIAMEHKKIVVQQDGAISHEQHDNTFLKEVGRKRRIVLRAMNSLWAERVALLHNPGLLTKLLFHKVIRWLTLPLLWLGTLAGALSGTYFGQAIVAPILFYLIASLTLFLWAKSKNGEQITLGKISNILLYSYTVFWASSLAFYDFLRRRKKIVWESRN